MPGLKEKYFVELTKSEFLIQFNRILERAYSFHSLKDYKKCRLIDRDWSVNILDLKYNNLNMTRPEFKCENRKTIHLLGLLIIIGLGCASNPENVKPSYVSALRYKKYTCEELLVEHSELINMYSVAAKEQK